MPHWSAPELARSTCAACQHYSSPGAWSAQCRLGPPDWMQPAKDHIAYSTVRADNSCGRWASVMAEAA